MATRTMVAPNLVVSDGRAATAFYVAAFGAVVLHGVPDGGVAQLAIDGAEFWVGEEYPAGDRFVPAKLTGRSVGMILTVPDPDATWAAAVAAGATPGAPMGDSHGWRLGSVVDPFGHHWEIGRPLG